MYDPNNPVSGQMTTLGAGPKPFDSYAQQQMGALGALGGHGQKIEGWRNQWRAARPQMGSELDWRTALMGWRGSKRDYKFGQVPGQMPAAQPAQSFPTPVINGQLPLNPYGG